MRQRETVLCIWRQDRKLHVEFLLDYQVDIQHENGLLCQGLSRARGLNGFEPIDALYRFSTELGDHKTIDDCLRMCVLLAYKAGQRNKVLSLSDIQQELKGRNAVVLHLLFQLDSFISGGLSNALQKLIELVQKSAAKKAVMS